MFEADDAYTLVSKAKNPTELAYAEYANAMKAMGNAARKAMITTKDTPYNPEARTIYKKEVDSLEAKLNVALKNAPRERQAQTIANAVVQAKKKDNPDMTNKEIKKAGQQALDAARRQVGAKKEQVVITDREWEAIQAGAISTNKLKKILDNADMDKVKQLATPKSSNKVNTQTINRIKTLKANGYTNAEIANKLGISTSTVIKNINN